MKNKKNVLIFFVTSFIVFSLFFLVLFYYDPLKIFHKPWKYKTYLNWNMREQAAGIINNWNFDSVIMGTSVMENTSSKEASEILGGKFVNISIAGGDYYERKTILGYALRKHTIKKVLYSLDYLGGVRKGHPVYKMDKWCYLYDENVFNDFKIYINSLYLKCLFSTSSKKACMGWETDFDRPNAWYTQKKYSTRFGGLSNWFKAKDDPQIKAAFANILATIHKINAGKYIKDDHMDQPIALVYEYLDNYIVSLVYNYPKTEFIFIVPPYSRIKFAMAAQYNKAAFRLHNEALKYLVLQSQKYSNMKVYAWGNHTFVDDIANYKDLTHYGHKINSWMLLAIKNGEGLLTSKNIDNYLSTFRQKSLDYNLSELGGEIYKYLYDNQK